MFHRKNFHTLIRPFFRQNEEKSSTLEGETVGDIIKEFLINYGNNLKEFLNPKNAESWCFSHEK